MQRKPIFMLIVVLLICWLSVWSTGVAIGSQPAQGEAGVDLLLLVDASPSMDAFVPEGLVDDIALLILRYLPKDTNRIGIVCFGEGTRIWIGLAPVDKVQWQQCPSGEVGTDFAQLLQNAPQAFREEPRPENRKVILLITDGIPGEVLGPFQESDKDRELLRQEVAPQIDALKALDENPTLHIIGVGDFKYADFWNQYNFIRVEDSDGLINIRNLLAELFAIAPSPSPTPTLTSMSSPSPSPTSTSVPTVTQSPSPSPASTSVLTATPSPSLTPTSVPTLTPPPSPTWTPSPSPTLTTTPTSTVTPTNTPASSPTPRPTSEVVGPVFTPTPTPTTRPEGIVMSWSRVGTVVFLITGLMGGLAVMVWRLRVTVERWKEETAKREKIEEDLREKDEALTKAIRASQLEKEARKSKTLLRKAEKALEREEPGQARRFAEQVIENAVQYGEAVLDRMAADVGEAFDIISRATEDKGGWADILFKCFREGSLIVQRGLASALKIWWASYPNEAIESIYALISKGGQDILKLVGDREASWPEGVPEVIENNAKMVENICKSLHSLLARESDKDLASLLSEVADAFGAASDTFAYAGDAQALYRCMAQLAEHPLWPVEFPAFSETTLPYFRYVAWLLQQGFTLPSPAWEGLPQLKQLEQEVSSHAE